MAFADNLKKARLEKGLSQPELAALCGVSVRTIQYYENNQRHPSRLDKVSVIAKALGTTSMALLGEEGMYIVDAAERGGTKAKKEVQEILDEVTSLFAGGELGDSDKDEVMRLIQEAYWDAKKINKKYGAHKNRS